jgi:hypothetical protein
MYLGASNSRVQVPALQSTSYSRVEISEKLKSEAVKVQVATTREFWGALFGYKQQYNHTHALTYYFKMRFLEGKDIVIDSL